MDDATIVVGRKVDIVCIQPSKPCTLLLISKYSNLYSYLATPSSIQIPCNSKTSFFHCVLIESICSLVGNLRERTDRHGRIIVDVVEDNSNLEHSMSSH